MGLLLSILGIVVPDSSANTMETRQVVNTQVDAVLAVGQGPNVGNPAIDPNGCLLCGSGYGGPFSQVKRPTDRRPDLRPWEGNVEGDVGSRERSSCFVAPPGYRNTYPARSEGSGDGRKVDDCTGTLPTW